MSEEVINFKERTEFENSLKQRNFEIDLFWKRSWFFGALILALIGGYYKLKSETAPLFPPITISFIVTITTLFQCFMNRGSKYWQERWEYMTMNRESALRIELTKLKEFTDEENNEDFYIDASILSKRENVLTKSRRFSVSKLTFLVWDIIFLCSLLVWLNESVNIFSLNPDWRFTIQLAIFYITLITYICFFWVNGKVYEPYIGEQFKDQDLDKINQKYINNDFSSSSKSNNS